MASQNISASSINNKATLFWCANLLLLGWFLTSVFGITIKGQETDREALLAIKSQISDDPLGVTLSWNNSVGLCQWEGITCGSRHQRVTMLDLSQQKLNGTLAPHVGNLSFLRFINLTDNNFHGVIPPEIGRLSRLESFRLDNNSFGGTIPTNLTHCSNLREFFAYHNKLVGNIPTEIGNLLKLEKLYMSENKLTGQLPASLGNISTLQVINIGDNYLNGRLPDTLGLLKRLVQLRLTFNNFTGPILPSLGNISSLQILNLGGNLLSGSLPDNSGSNFPNLIQFIVAQNKLSGTLPESLYNTSNLEMFEVSYNSLRGKVSINCENTPNLKWLNVQYNNMGSGGDGDLDFITPLTNCSMLDNFSISQNKFGGLLPSSIVNLSTTLTKLYLGRNQITGTIPSGIANLRNLTIITLEENQMNGTIPDSLGELKNLQWLDFYTNAFTGRIPPSLGNLSLLSVLQLHENLFEGSIPAELGKCQTLSTLGLRYNQLTGPVPKELFSIVTLSSFLDLSYNFLTGSIPSEVGSLNNLVGLYLSGNMFSGEIPSSLSSCTSLEILYLHGNRFNGSIPNALNSLTSIKELDLSNNNLSGQIPKYLEKFAYLEYLNLSHNRFEGQVPKEGVFSNATEIELIGNGRLCGGIAELRLPSCPNETHKGKRTLVIVLIVCGVVGILLLSLLVFCWLRKRGVKKEPSSTFDLGNSILTVSFHQLLKATNGFASTNLIGQGSFGRVYKGVLDQNQEPNIVAVKVMNMQEHGASKSFLAECKTLKNVRHRNLVKIISACSSIDFQRNPFKALIYEFMPNGSLEQWLHSLIENNANGHGEPKILNFLQRLNIAIDVASALDYLHHQGEVAIVHCDLKPSNILLDQDMVARVGDFGLARFFPKSLNFSGNSSSTLGLKGTVGYAAPEYGIGTEATRNGDMYSFGILVLEMFTGKRPTNDMFKDGLTLHHSTKMALPDQVFQVVDPLLLARDDEEEDSNSSSNPSNSSSNPSNRSRNSRRAEMEEAKFKECLISIFNVGIACSLDSPNDRMDITNAAKELHFARDKFLRSGTQRQS